MAKLKVDDIDLDSLESKLSKVIAGAFKKGTDDAFSAKSFMKDLNDQMKAYTKEQETQLFNDRVKALSLRTGLDTKEIELRLLAKRAKMENDSLVKQLEMNRVAKFALSQRAQNLVSQLKARGADEEQIKKAQNLLYLYRGQTEAIVDQQNALGDLKKENALIEEATKERLKQLKAEREKAALQAKQDAYAEKIKEVKSALLGQFGITEKIIDQLKTPELAKAIFAQQMIEKIGQATDTFKEFKKQGLSSAQAVEAGIKSFSFKSLVGLADNKGVMNGIIEQYGNVNALSSELVDNLGEMAHQFGISGEEALALNASLSQMPGETSQSAANSMKQVGAMAKLQGIAPGKIMKDMAKNTEAMALFGSRGAVAFGKAVIELHKMGVELSTSVSMAKGLLDFESSINAQMEASVLLGREINLDKAREMALNHDIEGATREVLRNVGGQAEFGRMNMVQQEALAKSAGMTTEQLQKALDAQVESNKYSGESAGYFKELLGTTVDWLGAVKKGTGELGPLLFSLYQMVMQYKLINALKMKSNAIPAGGGAPPVPDGAGGVGGAGAVGKLNVGSMLQGAAALLIVAAALYVSAKAFQEFATVEWPSVAKGIVGLTAMVGVAYLLGKVKGEIIQGSVAVAILGVALIPFAYAMSLIAGLDMKAVVAAGVGLLEFGAAIFALGGIMMLGGAFIFGAGILAITALGLGIGAFAENLSNLAKQKEGLAALKDIVSLGGIGIGIGAVGVGLDMITTALGKMNNATPPVIDKLLQLAASAPKFQEIGNALSNIANGGGEKDKEDKLDKLISAVETLASNILNKKGDVTIDGKAIGHVLAPIISKEINYAIRS
jgi:hypothetical protein